MEDFGYLVNHEAPTTVLIKDRSDQNRPYALHGIANSFASGNNVKAKSPLVGHIDEQKKHLEIFLAQLAEAGIDDGDLKFLNPLTISPDILNSLRNQWQKKILNLIFNQISLNQLAGTEIQVKNKALGLSLEVAVTSIPVIKTHQDTAKILTAERKILNDTVSVRLLNEGDLSDFFLIQPKAIPQGEDSIPEAIAAK